jgi:hypothetical protein
VPSVAETADDARSTARGGCGDGPHRMRVVGGVRQGSDTRVDCERPLRAVCLDCGHVEHWTCQTYGCAHCGEIKRRRLTRLVDDGAAIHLANGMVGYFLTLTAPGEREHLRWYQGRRPATRERCGCHEHGLTDGQWNRQESGCWNRLRTALTDRMRVIFVGAVETQDRGLLHRHLMLFVDDELTHEQVQQLALAAGYGCVMDLEPVRSSAKAARYVSKYVTKSSGDRAVVPWEVLDPETGELLGKRATYRLWSASRAWGVTMREIRATAALQARARALYLRELGELLASETAGSGTEGTSGDSGDPPPG